MKPLLTLVLFLALSLLTGCVSYDAKLPLVSGSSVKVTHVDSFGSVTIEADGVAVTDTDVKADNYKSTVSYPFWHGEVEVKDYRRVKVKVPANP